MAIWTNLTERWSNSDLTIRDGVTSERIKVFENQYSVVLPQQVVDYFRFVDGMDDEMYRDMYRFWKLEQVRPVFDVLSGHDFSERDAYPSYFVFADYMINSWCYAVLLTEDGQQPAPVRFVTYSDSPGGFAANSFQSFMQQYCEDPDQLLL